MTNDASAPVVLREYSFGDGPETTSKLIEIQPGDKASVPCGYLREYRLEDKASRVLPKSVLCSAKATVVITDQDLKADP